MKRPDLSIVVPTCNRQEYLVDCISVVQAHYPEAEVVVCDNSDDDRLAYRLASFVATGLVNYAHHPGRLSVVENFDLALAMARGRYLMFIGDDDSIGPELRAIMGWIIANDVDAAVSYTDSFLANYFWPGVVSKYFGGGYEARMFIRPYSGTATKLDGRRAIRDAAKMLGHGPGDMPRLYQGIVSRKLVEKVRSTYDCVFGGVSPDIFSAALLSYHCENAYRIDFPFVIPGGSPQSTAGQGAAWSDIGRLSTVDHISRFGPTLKWSLLIPDFYAPTNVWAYSLEAALHRINDPEIRLRYIRLYVKNLLQYRGYRDRTLESARRYWRKVGLVSFIWEGARSLVAELGFYCRKALRLLIGRRVVIGGLPTISAAYTALESHNADVGVAFRPDAK